jgi:NADP-dependent aldehyde dehydrogenase
VLVSAAIACALADGLAELEQVPGVERLTRPADPHTEHGFRTRPVAYHAHISVLEGHPVVGEEQFGPAVVILAYGDDAELRTALATLGGQLTMSLHSEPSEYADLGWLVNLCTEHCGRLVFDGYPTGVSVGWAMQHGGPYPATTDSRSTSVGMTATRRFLRPVTYQNAPLELLPQPLRNGNPLRVLARVDGDLTRDY